MTRHSRVASALAALILFVASAFASDSNLRPDTKVVFAGVTVGVTATQTSSAFSAIGQSKDMSIQFQATGGSTSYKLEVLCSLDEVNFVKPETGGDVGTFTDGNFHVVALAPPFCKVVKIKATQLDTGHDSVLTATICSQ